MTPTFHSRVNTVAQDPDWLQMIAVAIAGVALLLVMTVGLGAQEPAQPAAPLPPTGPPPSEAGERVVPDSPAPMQPLDPTQVEVQEPAAPGHAPYNYSDPNWREQALQAHRARVAALLNERREQQAAEQAAQVAATEAPPAPEMPEPVETTAEPAFRGNAELISEPLNIFATVGEDFLTAVTLRNLAATELDRVRICIGYDPEVLRPLRVSDAEIRNLLAEEPVMTSDPARGQIVYDASFTEPFSDFRLLVLEVQWQALIPTVRSEIELITAGREGTRLERAGRNVMGEADVANDGAVDTEVVVQAARTEDPRSTLLTDDPETLRAMQGVEPRGDVSLRLESPSEAIAVGDTFAVDVVLENPEETPIDDLRFTVEFDPRVLQVVDAAEGRSRHRAVNWISRGVNLYDEPYHEDYPFDFHLRNQADNALGVAEYHMGLSRARALPSGTVAQIYFEASAPARETPLSFVQGRERLVSTSVRCIGVDVLGKLDDDSDGLIDTALQIEPAVVTAQPAGEAPRGI